MKINKLFIAAGLFAMTIASCTDLNIDLDSLYATKPSTPEADEATLNDLYIRFRGTLGRRYMEATCLSSDEYTSLAYSGNWVDGYTYAHSSYHNYSYEDAVIDWMEDLGRANVAAQEIVNSEASDKDKALARVMRAFHTFLMMDMWGDVPIADGKYVEEHQLDPNNRHPRAEVVKYIEKELTEVIASGLLPTDVFGANYGKPTKYMAQALLAKLYINWAVYTAESVDKYDAATAQNEKLADCIKVCDELINSGVFNLGDVEYRFKFAPNNTELVKAGKIKDFIYAMEYDTNEAQGMQWGRSHVYKDVKSLDPSMFGEKLGNSGGAYMTLTPECVDRFNLKGDQRNWMIIGLKDKDMNDANGQVYVYDQQTLLPTAELCKDKTGNPLVFTKNINVTGELASVDVGDDLEGWRQGYRSAKWFLCNTDYSNGRNQSNDVPFFRYADILLIKAEALVRTGKSGAKDLINQIRSYAKAETLASEATLDDVYNERGREFFDEIWRRNDMIRFGHYEDEWFPHYKNNPNASFDKTKRVFPVKKGDLDLNPVWSQNPGY